jgi:acetylornithine deacetylase/succinyl-diaminopimelate desuccinylase-like protein
MKKISRKTFQHIIELGCALQQIPAPTFAEEQRAVFLEKQFQAAGLTTQRDAAGNVLAQMKGGTGKPIIVSAHLDTVHPADCALKLTRSEERMTGPGIGDNSISLAALVGLAEALRDEPLPGDVWLVGNTAEEGLGNLAGMQAVVERFGSEPLAYLVLEGMGLGLVYHRGLGVSRYRIRIDTAGGHSWGNYGLPSAIHEIAVLINRLTHISLPKRPRTSLNVGMISGGTSINTIASRASIDLDLRSEDFATLRKLIGKVQQRVKLSEGPGVQVTMQEIGDRPAGEIALTHPLVREAQACLLGLGIQPQFEVGSTDANVPLSRGYPAICVGLTRGGNAHTSEEYILIEPLETGLNQVLCLLERIGQAGSGWQTRR